MYDGWCWAQRLFGYLQAMMRNYSLVAVLWAMLMLKEVADLAAATAAVVVAAVPAADVAIADRNLPWRFDSRP